MHLLQGWPTGTETSLKSSLVYHHNTNDSHGAGHRFNNRRETRNTLRRKQRTTTVMKRNSTWHPLAIRAELQHTPLELWAQSPNNRGPFWENLPMNHICQLFQILMRFCSLCGHKMLYLVASTKTTDSAFYAGTAMTRKAWQQFSRVRVVDFTAQSSRKFNKKVCSAVCKIKL